MLAFLIRFLSFFALCLWVGGGAAIGFLAAPVIFEKAGSRRLAGEIVGDILRRFDTYVFVAGPIALLMVLLEMGATVGAGRTMSLRVVLVAAMLGLALYSRFSLTPEIRRLREEMGDELDHVPREDPRRRAFGRLHGFSVLCLMAEILLGAFAIALAVMTLSVPGG